MTDAATRAETAKRLREEAQAVLHSTGLLDLLIDRYGRAEVTGSAAYDLMVRRSVDLRMPVEADRYLEWADLCGDFARTLAANSGALHRASFRNDYADPDAVGGGLYWSLVFEDSREVRWTCDLWGWEPFDLSIRQSRDDSFRVDLRRASRDLILKLKTEALARVGDGGQPIPSFDIYQFAMARAGETFDDLESWRARTEHQASRP